MLCHQGVSWSLAGEVKIVYCRKLSGEKNTQAENQVIWVIKEPTEKVLPKNLFYFILLTCPAISIAPYWNYYAQYKTRSVLIHFHRPFLWLNTSLHCWGHTLFTPNASLWTVGGSCRTQQEHFIVVQILFPSLLTSSKFHLSAICLSLSLFFFNFHLFSKAHLILNIHFILF